MNPIHNSLGRLRQRVNVTTRHPLDGDQLVILYDDHRWLLNVMFKIQKEKLLPEPPKLIFFDSHDDCAGTRPKSDLLSSLDVENLLDASEKDFASFVDYEIGTDDGNWLSVACELNLISDAVVIGAKHGTNIDSETGTLYKSEDGTEHHLYKLSGNLEYELGCRGSLGDRCLEKEYKGIREFFDIKYGNEFARIGDITPFILDYDLDFFTLDSDEGTLAWPLMVWEKHYNHFSPENRFVKELINKAIVVTVCREPDYCGNIAGIAGANYNLENLDRYFFNGDLGTRLNY